jgi:site-specific recombinase XerD
MKNEILICQNCGELKKIYHNEQCRRCCSVQWNTRSLRKIAKDFKPASDYNKYLFRLYLKIFDKNYIKNSELPVAKKLAQYMSKVPVLEIKSWDDVHEISSQAKIHYANVPTQGCPFIRLGRILEQLKKIEARQSSRVMQRKNLFAQFRDPKTKDIVQQFYDQIRDGHKATSSSLKVIKSVQIFFENIDAPWKAASKNDAQKFIEKKLKSYGSAHYTERVRSIARFYAWAKEKQIVKINPFENLVHDHLIKNCKSCEKRKPLWTSNEYCDLCYKNRQYQIKLKRICNEANFGSDYNQYLFDLYLKYIRRYLLRKCHLVATEKLISFLKQKGLRPILNWADVLEARRSFNKFSKITKVLRGGCPVEKVAYVLQELGVLPIRESDKLAQLKTMLEQIDPKISKLMKEYAQQLRKNNRSVGSQEGTIRMVHNFFEWLKTYQNCTDLFLVTEFMAQDYILSKKDKDRAGIQRLCLGKFYHWCVFKKKTLLNPFEKIEKIKMNTSLEICSGRDIKKLEKHIKSITTDPETAMILCLIFYFGFTVKDLTQASLEITPQDEMKIILREETLSYRKKKQKRSQIFLLPLRPDWLYSLKCRYLQIWRSRYQKIKQDFPTSPLFIRSDSRHGRNVRSLAILEILNEDLTSLFGYNIPPAVLRRTGAHIYSNQVGASVLTELGWSQDYAWDFVWKQRKLFTPKSK